MACSLNLNLSGIEWEKWEKKDIQYSLKEIVDKYSFDIYEYSQTKDSRNITNFFEEIREMGYVRSNDFVLDSYESSVEFKEYIKTSLGNIVIFQSVKPNLYNNHYKVFIR